MDNIKSQKYLKRLWNKAVKSKKAYNTKILPEEYLLTVIFKLKIPDEKLGKIIEGNYKNGYFITIYGSCFNTAYWEVSEVDGWAYGKN